MNATQENLIKTTFLVRLCRYERKENGDWFPVILKEWNLGLVDALKLFADTVEAHPNAISDSGTIDSIEYEDNDGKFYSLFIAD